MGMVNEMVDIIRKRGEINVEKLALMLKTTAYQIKKAWMAVGDEYSDIRVTPDGTFYVVKKWREEARRSLEAEERACREAEEVAKKEGIEI
jgi:hypothetical protein